MKKNTGYTLIEVLITLAILSIVSGISYVSYQGYTLTVNKKDLKTHGKLFAKAIKSCVMSNGDWKIVLLKPDGSFPSDAEKSALTRYPCLVESTPTKTQDTIRKELKKKLGFTCPPAPAKCFTATSTSKKYTCLSIEKEVSGKYLQVLARVPYSKPNEEGDIWCGSVNTNTSYVPRGRACKDGETWQPPTPPGQSKPPRASFSDKGFKQDKNCWK